MRSGVTGTTGYTGYGMSDRGDEAGVDKTLPNLPTWMGPVYEGT